MGYLHIDNLYKNQDILLFKECYALEKIHGTSAHISWRGEKGLHFFSGGSPAKLFEGLFDKETLEQKLKEKIGDKSVTIYGEAYGGKEQGMSATYGKELKFVVFDVKIDELWLNVPAAEAFATSLGLEFVHYIRIPTDILTIDAERDADSVQAVRNGVGSGKKREGVILRPLVELRGNNSERVISKHKRAEFKETKTPREVDPDKLAVLTEATTIAEEWVTVMRLQHVLDKLPQPWDISQTPDVIHAMIEDVIREAAGEIVDSKEVRKAIGKKTSMEFKRFLKHRLSLSCSMES